MSYLEKLLKGTEVEWKTLECLAENLDSMRKPVANGSREAGDIPYYGASGIVDYVKDYIFDGEFLLISEDGANLIARSTPIAFSISGKSWVNNHAHVLKFNTYAERRFVEYFLNSIDLTPYISGAAQPKLNQRNLNSIKIPNPSPEVKEKVVSILDTFTEVTAELTARKKQYSYYREILLSFEEGEVEWKTLGEVAVYAKERISSNKLDITNYVGVDNLLQNRHGRTNSSYVPKAGSSIRYNAEDILIGNIRPYLKKIWYANQGGGTNGDVLIIQLKDKKINKRYLYQVLSDDRFFEFNMQHAKGAKMPRGNKKKILEYSIPIPSLEEQARIVSILDKFDILTTSISEGLPKEIELRKKQYEHYRDLLLTFPKNNIAS